MVGWMVSPRLMVGRGSESYLFTLEMTIIEFCVLDEHYVKTFFLEGLYVCAQHFSEI